MFGVDEKKVLILEHYIAIPTGDKNFNIAMAIVGVLIVIKEQFSALGFRKALYEYFPILGKDYIPYTRGSMHPAIDWPLFLFVKACDIVISMFLGVLEIVGHIAKVVSLSFRLFGNIMAG
jgi:F0F1-type ATP synthase membrane subunit a